MKRTAAPLAIALLVFAASLVTGSARAETTVYAAASATDALNEIAAAFAAKKLGTIVPSYDSSSTLAKQIEHGAPASIFLSADEQWMDYLDQKKLIAAGSRSDLLGNSLVMVAPKSNPPAKIDIGPGMMLAKMLGDGRLAVGDPDHVPAGIYAKAALAKLGLWDQVKDKLAAAQNVRAALAYVERGETPLGIVYATDAIASAKVWEVGIFPESSHPPILYPVALVAGHETPEARAFLDFLKGPAGMAVFQKYGFRPILTN
jgi:molybdate transport system substrate-binding protein